MIEPRVTPLPLFMAIAALLTKLSAMVIVVAMAIHATSRCCAVFGLRLVAGGAIGTLVRAMQFEIRRRMIESTDVQKHNIGRSAQMIAMTLFAGFISNRRRSSMEPGLLHDILCDVPMVVTAQTLSRLVIALRPAMALFTVFLERGMCIAEFARHEQFFQRRCTGITNGRNGYCDCNRQD